MTEKLRKIAQLSTAAAHLEEQIEWLAGVGGVVELRVQGKGSTVFPNLKEPLEVRPDIVMLAYRAMHVCVLDELRELGVMP